MTTAEPKIIPRSEWGAAKATSVKPFEKGLPVFEVLLSLNSGLAECTDVESCKKVMQEGQKKAMQAEKLPDIPYSFVIGPAGEIYEGRGWESKPQKAIQMEGVDFHPVAYDIGFFGNYAKVNNEGPELPDVQFDALESLVKTGIKKKYLEEEYDYVSLHAPFEPMLRPAKDTQFKPIEEKEPIEAQQEEQRTNRPGGFTYTTTTM